MSNATCLLMLAGDPPAGLALAALRELAQGKPYIIAADGGAKYLADLGLRPDLLVGDYDSLDEATLAYCRDAGVELTSLPREKDFTDGEAAFRAACRTGCKNMAVFGALGGNLDHQLGNLLLPLALGDNRPEPVFYGRDCRAFYCFGQSEIWGHPGDIISLLPLSPVVTGLTLRGFRYPLHNACTALGESLCLRNELSSPTGRVELAEGIMLIIHYPQI